MRWRIGEAGGRYDLVLVCIEEHRCFAIRTVGAARKSRFLTAQRAFWRLFIASRNWNISERGWCSVAKSDPAQDELGTQVPLKHRSEKQSPVATLTDRGTCTQRHGPAALLVVMLIASALVRGISAQDLRSGGGGDEQRVEKLSFRGVDGVAENTLRASIVTQETRCRSLILQPFCWVGDWPLVVEHEYLDLQELQRDVVRLRVVYFRHGYRDVEIAAEIQPLDGGVEVVFDVLEGELTRIGAFELRQSGEVLSDRTIRRARLPDEDDPLNLVALDLGMTYLQERLSTDGYLDALVQDTIDVDSQTQRARVAVVIEPGRRSTMGELAIRGNAEVTDGTISEALRLKEGRVLRANDIVAARRSLYESNLFHEVDVSVPEQADSAKRVEVTVREAPPRTIRIGGGLNTVEFIQSEARYTHYDWLGSGRRLDLRATLGNLLASQLNGRLIFRSVVPEESLRDEAPFLRPTWTISAGFMQPAFQSAENILGIDLFANRRTIPGIVVDKGYGADVSVTRRIDYNTPVSLSYTYELTSVEAGDLYFCVNYGVCETGSIQALRGSNAMSPIGLSLVADRADNPLSPSSGHRARLSVEHASAFTASDFRYNRITGEITYYLPLDVHRRRVVAGRARVGWVRNLAGTAEAIGIDPSNEEDALLHPRKRFYAGGANSVRGYGENQLGPQTLTIDPVTLIEADPGCSEAEIGAGECDPGLVPMGEFLLRPIGGTVLFEAGLEYRVPFGGRLTGAAFIDGAIIGERLHGIFSDGRWAVTPGIGIRFASPVGPVRLDLGVRPNTTQRLPVVTEYVDDDDERHLVELGARRSYNAVEAAGGGFLDEIFSRLALHLSIGEAY